MQVADSGTADAKVLAKLPNDSARVLKQPKKMSPDTFMLRVCYEAGPTGYGLCRRLRKEGIHCIVVAPSLVASPQSQCPFSSMKSQAFGLIGISTLFAILI